MTNTEDNQNKTIDHQETEQQTQSQPEKSPSELRQERLDQIDHELGGINYQATSPKEIQNIQGQREQEYRSKVEELEQGLGKNLSDESKEMIRKNIVDNTIEHAQRDNEIFDALQKEKVKLETISSKVKGILADNPEMSEEDATRYATEEAEQGITHKPLTIEGDSEEVKERQAESERIRDKGETIEQPLDSERGLELTQGIKNVAKLFNEMGVKWKLDGALNISLREIAKDKDAYFRMHRDIDAHVIGDIDGEQLSKLLKEARFEGAPHGYGAFVKDDLLNRPELMKKRGYLATEFNKGETPELGLQFFRLDKSGNPQFKIGEIVIDVHCSKDKLKSITGYELPESWQTPNDKVNIDGELVSLDNVGSVLYHKLTTNRNRDFIDIDFMVDNDQIKLKNIDEVRDVIEKDLKSEDLHTDQREVLQDALTKLDELKNKK